ncbi:unnamed protein product, partial [Mesorhabditis spiculigera]
MLTIKNKVAIAQIGSLLFQPEESLAKIQAYAKEAAENGAKLVVFPEAFLGGYPKFSDFGISLGSRSEEGRNEFSRYYSTAIAEYGEEHQALEKLAQELNIHLVTGVVEKSGKTLYCSVFFFGPSGYMGKHRKLLPTALERCVWGNGDGSTMATFETSELGTIGAAICWENYMPLYRTHLYSQGIQLYLAPTVDDRDAWISTMKHIAVEGRCFVISACQYITGENFPEGHPMREKHGKNVLIRGGSCVIDPFGKVLMEPNYEGEKLLYADVNTEECIRGKFDLDVVGHYSRPDVFTLTVDTSIKETVVRK